MKKYITIAVYGNFAKKEIRTKLMRSQEQYRFQNILRDAGYDCELHTIELEEETKEK